VHYEATRAGLDPQLVLGLMQVESGFKKYAVSSAGARGYMQVMPFWVKLIGAAGRQPLPPAHQPALRLHHPAPLPRYRKGDLYRALGRYNGSLGQPEYPEHGRVPPGTTAVGLYGKT
jgi:soluble lytic murein transglycosylase-like protein